MRRLAWTLAVVVEARRRAFLRVAAGLEAMERLPPWFLTGYFVAAQAIRQ
jgi:hypothetical protein